MDIAQQLKERSIAEYLLYMWQQEDLVRAYNHDIDRLDREYLSRFDQSEEEREAMRTWYENLNEMMREEHVEEKGHVQVNRNIIILLDDLHAQLLHSSKHPFYSAAYYKALPFIVELRSKSGTKDESEIENCFDALYGLLLLRLQGKNVSKETQGAMKSISDFLAQLSAFYKEDKEGTLEL